MRNAGKQDNERTGKSAEFIGAFSPRGAACALCLNHGFDGLHG